MNDAPGMLRVRLRDDQRSSGSGNDFATALVVAEHAERAAFARQALAVKLRELDEVCVQRDFLVQEADRVARECRALAIECEIKDGSLTAAIAGRLRNT